MTALLEQQLHEAEMHRAFFVEFAANEKRLGGPDPQLQTMIEMLHGDQREDAWRLGCFAATYAIGPAEAIWQYASFTTGPPPLEWIKAHWEGLPLRRERRAVRTPEKLRRCLLSAWTFAINFEPMQHETFGSVYNEVSTIYGMGRYINLKFCELLHRRFGTPEQHDLQAKGGWSPRTGMASMLPMWDDVLMGGDSPEEVEQVEALAEQLRFDLAAEEGLWLSWFELQVFLCEYKQALRGKKYPGRSHDSELTYWRKTQDHFGQGSQMLAARANLFPPEVLGELNGWADVRPECERTLVDEGYMWSDLDYDYALTTDFRNPVRR